MVPVVFKGANQVGQLPPQNGIQMEPLPMEVGDQGITTCWKPTPAELELLNSGGVIGLTLLGNFHPPVQMDVRVHDKPRFA